MHTTEEFLHKICHAQSKDEAYYLFNTNSDLQSYRFIISTKEGFCVGYAGSKKFSATAAVQSLFQTNQLAFIDTDTCAEMSLYGESTLKIDYSISLDTNVVSYLWPYISKNKKGAKDFIEVLDFIARDDVFVDPLPYFYENMTNILDLSNSATILNRLKGYEILRNLDGKKVALGNFSSHLSDCDLTQKANEMAYSLYKDATNKVYMGIIKMRHTYMLCQLLQMVIIQLSSAKQIDPEKKLMRFIEFCDSTLATIDCRAIAIAKEYFTRGTSFSFFKKIQKGRAKLFKDLSGMAWDMWHVRQLEENLSFKPAEEADYFISAILTFDAGLLEMMRLNPLKGLACSKETRTVQPFFAKDPAGVFSDDRKKQDMFAERFYSPHTYALRSIKRKQVMENLESIKTTLIKEVESLTGVLCSQPSGQ